MNVSVCINKTIRSKKKTKTLKNCCPCVKQELIFVKTVTPSVKLWEAQGGLTLTRIAAGDLRVFWPGGLLFGETDDAGDFTACSKSSAFDLSCVSTGGGEEQKNGF